MRFLSVILGGVLLFVGTFSAAWTPDKWFDKPRSSRAASYRIQATLDWPAKTLEGSETITWRNEGFASTQEVPLHLYLNAFKGPQTLFAREGGRGPETDPYAWGYCLLKDVRVEGQPLTGHFGEDETVYWLKLPRVVGPGESIRIDIAWESRFPRIVSRSGWTGASPATASFLMAAQWFPKVGVYQGSQWNCHAYHANTEFFADFGVYDVALSVPNALLIAHTGTQTNFTNQEDVPKDPKKPGHVIWKLHAEDVHDFAWAAAPAGDWTFTRQDYRGVQVFYYHRTSQTASLERQKAAIQAAMKLSAEWYFPYPYPVLSVLNVPDGAAGMEYPTLLTSTIPVFEPWRLRTSIALPTWPHVLQGGSEQVDIHEFGHQYFQGMLASNELEEPWLDEGITSWFTQKAMARSYQALLASERFQIDTDLFEVIDYWSAPSIDPMTLTGFQMMDAASYQRLAYAKPVLVLNQLEIVLGRPVMERVMRTYAQEMAFGHPTSRDFKRIAEQVSGKNLDAFWRDFIEGTDTFDVVIHQVGVRDMSTGGWMATPKGHVFVDPQPSSPRQRGTLTLLRRGGIIQPITIWVRLENRMEHRLTWDGRDRWMTYEFDSPIAAAILDPDGQYPILKDRMHATYTSKPTRRGLHYWSQMIWGAFTALLQGAGLG